MEKGAGHGVRGQSALSPVAPRQRLSEQKALSPRGLQNVSPHSEISDVLSGLFRHHTLLNLSDYTRLCRCSARAKFHNFPAASHPQTLLEERGSRKVTRTFFSGKKLPSPEFSTKPHWKQYCWTILRKIPLILEQGWANLMPLISVGGARK